MGLYTIGLTQQQRGSASGKQMYPALAGNQQDLELGDEFQREAILPTGGYTLYTTNTSGSGSATISNTQALVLTTGATIGNDVNVRVSGLSFNRISNAFPSIDNRSQMIFDIVFNLTAATSTEGFIGIVIQNTTLTALPTTARHAGIFWDRSASANYTLTSANDSDQSTTDSGVALVTTDIRVRITWNGTDDVLVEFFDGTGLATLQATHTVTSMGGTTFQIHFFVQTETAGARAINIAEWKVAIA